MQMIDLALKDLVQVGRDRKSAFFLVIMPVLFTLALGFAFSGSAKQAQVKVGWVNRDPGGVLSERLKTSLEGIAVLDLVPLEGQQALRADDLVRDEKLLAALVVPADFSEQTLAGETVPVTVIAPSTTAGRAASTALQTAVKRLLGAVEAARLGVETYAQVSPFSSPAARRAYFDQTLAEAVAAWQVPPFTISTEQATGAAVNRSKEPSGFNQSSPGMIVMFAVFSLITSSMVLVQERKNRTLQRLLTTPITPARVIAGHMLAMFLIVFMQELLLVLIGQLVFKVNYLRDPFGTLLVMLALALWASSLGLLIGALARKEESVILLSLIAMFFFAPLGGAWFPLEITGKAFSAIGHLTPAAWAMDGFQNILLRGLGISSVLLPVGILLAYALGFFGLAVWRYKFE